MRSILAILVLIFAVPATAQTSTEFYAALATGNNTVWTAPIQGVDLPWGTYFAGTSQIEPDGNVMNASWVTADGSTVTVNTPKLLGESNGNQAWRHKAAIMALKNNPGMTPVEPAHKPPVYAPQSGGNTMSTSWTSGNMTHTVTTPPKEGEDPVDQAMRHGAGVAALKAIFPPEEKVEERESATGEGTVKKSTHNGTITTTWTSGAMRHTVSTPVTVP